jgi:hypothetical protein
MPSKLWVYGAVDRARNHAKYETFKFVMRGSWVRIPLAAPRLLYHFLAEPADPEIAKINGWSLSVKGSELTLLTVCTAAVPIVGS